MAVSYNKGVINGDLVVPVGTIIKPISVPAAGITNLIGGQSEVMTQPEQTANPYNPDLDSAAVAETAVTPVDKQPVVSDAPKFENPMASNETTPVDEPVIPVVGNQVVEAPKVEEPIVTDNVIQFPTPAIDPASLLSKEEPIDQVVSYKEPQPASDLLGNVEDPKSTTNNQTSFINQSAVNQNTDSSTVLQFPDSNDDGLDRIEEGLQTLVLMVQQEKQKKKGTPVEENQYKKAA